MAEPVERPVTPLGAPLGVFSTLRRAAAVLPEFRRGLGVTLALAAVGAAGRLILPILIRSTIDDGLGGADAASVSLDRVGRLCLAAVLATVVTQAGTRAAAYRLGAWSERMMAELRRRCVDRFLSMSLDEHAAQRRGALVARATTDVESIARFFEWGAISWLVNSVIVVVLAGFLLATDMRLGSLALVITLPVVLMLRWLQHRLLRAYSTVRAHVGAYLGLAAEMVSGAAEIRAYQAESVMRARAESSIEGRRRSAVHAGTLGALLFPMGELFGTLAIAAVVVAGVHIGPGGGLTEGTVVAVIFAASRLLDPVGEISENIDQTQLAVAGLSRVLDVLDPPLGGDGLHDLAGPRRPLPAGALGLEIDALSYAYPPRLGAEDDASIGADSPAVAAPVAVAVSVAVAAPIAEADPPVEPVWALSDVTLRVAAGTSLAIVGATGSGKSTMARLLVRAADPQHGAVSIGGVDVRAIDDPELRRRVQLVPQEPFLFDLTIADNVRIGTPDRTDGDVIAAFDRLGLSEWLTGLPLGLATKVGERGSELSAGERQLVALARAELLAPDVLVLDEATSSVDAAMETRVSEAIERIAAGRTTVVIAHRLSTAARADAIAVFDHGRLVEHGTHEALLRVEGAYAAFVRHWTDGVEAGRTHGDPEWSSDATSRGECD